MTTPLALPVGVGVTNASVTTLPVAVYVGSTVNAATSTLRGSTNYDTPTLRLAACGACGAPGAAATLSAKCLGKSFSAKESYPFQINTWRVPSSPGPPIVNISVPRHAAWEAQRCPPPTYTRTPPRTDDDTAGPAPIAYAALSAERPAPPSELRKPSARP
ncbi:hypothetical protein B0H17DRAFT_1201321 [Mycena rosella]|uniref:Uncharacterized protein n=1 Tax=Mycena rosella TaxID=1033263 RepID=A0AAD7DG68_MYCRO|nr:hypothetical protein B0H17DRAFT_1201321 [Mycena rosella]